MKKVGIGIVIGVLALFRIGVFATCEYANVTIMNVSGYRNTSGYEITYLGVGSKDSNIKPPACNTIFSGGLGGRGKAATTLLQVGSTITLQGKASNGTAMNTPNKLVVSSSQLEEINCGGDPASMSCNCLPSGTCSQR